jgi:hypothetical protein
MQTQNTFAFFIAIFLTAMLTTPGFGQGRDTVFAVRKLLREKRGSAAGYAAAADTAISRQRYARRPSGQPTAQEARQDVLGAAALATTGLAKAGRFSPEREAYIIEAYRLGNAIPADIRHKLRRRHFHVSARDLPAARP